MKRKRLTAMKITSQKQLRQRIRELSAQMESMEQRLQSDLSEVHQSLHASNMIHNAIKDIREQSELRYGIAQVATDIGAHALIDGIVFRKNHGVFNQIISIIFKKIADHFILKDRKNTTIEKF